MAPHTPHDTALLRLASLNTASVSDGQATPGRTNDGGLAAELQRHALDGAGRALLDRLADAGRAGEGNLVDAGVCRHVVAERGPVARDHVQHAVRQAALVAEQLRNLRASPRVRSGGQTLSAVRLVFCAGLCTITLPAASAGAIFQDIMSAERGWTSSAARLHQWGSSTA